MHVVIMGVVSVYIINNNVLSRLKKERKSVTRICTMFCR
jgi:hypothetical protein